MATGINVNGKSYNAEAAGDTPLLYVLRNDLALNGAKYGCGYAQCGACTVIMDGKAVRSCGTPHSLQKAFIAEQAAQCGYCANGMIMTAKTLLDKNPQPTEAQIRKALAANFCRCGTHNRIVRAIQRAAKEVA